MQESQEVSHFLTGDHKAARNRHDSLAKISTKTIKIHKRNTTLEQSVRNYCLNQFHVQYLTLIFYVNQDTTPNPI